MHTDTLMPPIGSTGPKRSPGFVLVVDDEEHNRTLLRDQLEIRGYEVDEAENGMQALQKIAARQPDVVLLDLMMPKMDGFEVCRHLRKDPRTAHLPILMVTALSERGDRLLGIQAGANDFLNKPIDTMDVILRVGNAVQVKRLHDQVLAEQAKSEQLAVKHPAQAHCRPHDAAARPPSPTVIPDATVLVADLVGFTTLSAHIDPEQLVHLLNEIFSAFDALVERHGLEKIKTIGDAYMVAGGITVPRPDHAEAAAELALDLQEEIGRLNEQYDTSIRLRIGISTGPVVAGVIGRKKFAFDVWGEAVNFACRLEATGEPGKIHISEPTFDRLKDKFHFEQSHNVNAKGHGAQPAFWLGQRVAAALH
jgi:adenylate cyclase